MSRVCRSWAGKAAGLDAEGRVGVCLSGTGASVLVQRYHLQGLTIVHSWGRHIQVSELRKIWHTC